MLCLLKSVALESLGNLGIALAVGLARHGQIHAYLTALALEMGIEISNHLLIATLGNAQSMLCSIVDGVFLEFLKLGCGHAALRATLGSGGSFVYIAAHGTNKFLVHSC